jgi:hypothetical protein
MRSGVTGVLILMSRALTSCGGDEQQSVEQQIRAVLQEALTSKDEGVCTRLFTRRFVEQRTVLRGDAAVRVCRDDYEPLATSVPIERARGWPTRGGGRPAKGRHVDLQDRQHRAAEGRRAMAARPVEGRDARSRRIAALSARLRKGPRSASDELPDGVHNCLLRVLRTSDDKELVRAIVGPDVRVFLLRSVICGLGPAPYARGVPSSVRTCVARPHQRVIKLGGEDDRDRSQAKRLAVTGSLRPSLLRQDLLRMKMYLRSEWALYIRTRHISR